MISSDLGYVEKERLGELRGGDRGCRENAESVDQVSGKQTLGSLNPGTLSPN
jgi:hypothetical protein